MAEQRDFQRSKVYAAERDLEFKSVEKTFKTKQETIKFFKKVVRSAFWKNRYGNLREDNITFNFWNGRRSFAYGWSKRLKISTQYMTDTVILHELAHLVANGDHHGARFAKVYLDLVKHYCGVKVWKILKAEFKAHKVKVSKLKCLTVESTRDVKCTKCNKTYRVFKNTTSIRCVACGKITFYKNFKIIEPPVLTTGHIGPFKRRTCKVCKRIHKIGAEIRGRVYCPCHENSFLIRNFDSKLEKLTVVSV